MRTCTEHPVACYDLCVGWSNAPACFELALAYERHLGDLADETDKERLYALACAGGYSAGCTNRAAGIRNRSYAGDPFRTAPPATKQLCEYGSFLLDCDRRGAWGCAMLGQALRNGEGVSAQPTRARAAFDTSCKIDLDFVACSFAKRQVEQMDEAGQPPPERTAPVEK